MVHQPCGKRVDIWSYVMNADWSGLLPTHFFIKHYLFWLSFPLIGADAGQRLASVIGNQVLFGKNSKKVNTSGTIIKKRDYVGFTARALKNDLNQFKKSILNYIFIKFELFWGALFTAGLALVKRGLSLDKEQTIEARKQSNLWRMSVKLYA